MAKLLVPTSLLALLSPRGAAQPYRTRLRGAGLSPPQPAGSCENGRLFQLHVEADGAACEASWTLQRFVAGGYDRGEDGYLRLAGHRGGCSGHAASRTLCLGEGRYRFVISGVGGDAAREPGYYLMAIDGEIVAGGTDFGDEESTTFTVTGRITGSVDEAAAEMAGGDAEATTTFTVSSPSSGSADEAATETASRDNDGMNLESDGLDDRYGDDSTSLTPDRLSRIIGVAPAVSHVDSSALTWTEMLSDDFEHDLGIFQAASRRNEYVTHHPFLEERRGVARLHNELGVNGKAKSSSILSEGIALDPKMKEVKLVFSFRAGGMEPRDGFCFDYFFRNTWQPGTCWRAGDDFDNGVWYDDVAVTFIPESNPDAYFDTADILQIGFRSEANGLHDGILIDKVQLMGLVQTELKIF